MDHHGSCDLPNNRKMLHKRKENTHKNRLLRLAEYFAWATKQYEKKTINENRYIRRTVRDRREFGTWLCEWLRQRTIRR